MLFHELRTAEPASEGLAILAGMIASGALRPRINIEADWAELGAVGRRVPWTAASWGRLYSTCGEHTRVIALNGSRIQRMSGNKSGPKTIGGNAMKYALGGLLLAGGLALSIGTAKADPLTLTSPQIQDNGTLAVKNACSDKQRSPNCVGENISPPLAWSGVPEGTKSFALLLFDPEGRAPAGVSHMVVYGIPADVKGFAEGELSQPSDKFVGGKSTMEKSVYFGPGTPPNTDWHHYTWTLVATDLDPKALQPGLTREELAAALKDHVKGSAGLITRFKHP